MFFISIPLQAAGAAATAIIPTARASCPLVLIASTTTAEWIARGARDSALGLPPWRAQGNTSSMSHRRCLRFLTPAAAVYGGARLNGAAAAASKMLGARLPALRLQYF